MDTRPAGSSAGAIFGCLTWLLVVLVPIILVSLLFGSADFAIFALLLLCGGLAWLVVNLQMQTRALQDRLDLMDRVWREALTRLNQPSPVQTVAAAPVEPAAPPRVEPQAPPRVEPEAPPRVEPKLPTWPEPRPVPAAPARPAVDWDETWRALAGPLGALGGTDDLGNTEARIGIVWFSRIGVLLILVSAIIGYIMLGNAWLQAGIGWAAGLICVGLSWWGQRRGYRPWAQAVCGGGIGLLYLVTTSAHMDSMLPAVVAFGLMGLTTVLGTFMAVRYDSIVVGLLAMVGGFATPFLLSSGQGNFVVLFTYVVILDLGLLGVAWFKRWSLYNYLLFAVTWIIYGGWRGAAYTPADAPLAFLFTGVYFAIFAGVAILYNIVHRQKSRHQDLAMVLINGFVFFASGLDLLTAGWARALFAFAMALAQLVLGVITLRRNPPDRLMQLSFLGLAGIFLTVAFPVALQGPWVSVAWALEAAALTWIGFITQEHWTRPAGLAIFGLAATGLLTWATFPDLYLRVLTWETLPGAGYLLAGMVPVHWTVTLPGVALRAFTFLTVIAAFYVAVWAHSRFGGSRRVMESLSSAASFLTLWYITFEITLVFDTARTVAAAHERLAIGGAWALYGLGLALAAARRFPNGTLRGGARLVLAGSLAYLVLACLLGNAAAAWMGARLVTYAVVFGSIWLGEYLLRERGAADAGHGVVSLSLALVGFFVGAYEVAQWFGPAAGAGPTPAAARLFWTVAIWGAYAPGVMIAGVRLGSNNTRILAAALTGVVQAVVLFAGLQDLSGDPLVRLLAFLMLVPGTYLSVWLARRAGAGGVAVEDTLLRWTALGAGVLTAIWGAVELWDALSGRAGAHAVVLWGGLYSLVMLVAGLRLASREARWIALLLLGMTVLALPWPLYVAGGVPALLWLKVATLASVAGSCCTAAWLLHRPNARDIEPDQATAVRWIILAVAVMAAPWGKAALRTTVSPELSGYSGALAACLYGLALVAAGLRFRFAALRLLGYGFQALAVVAGTVAAANPLPSFFERTSWPFLGGTVAVAYASGWLVRRVSERSTVGDMVWTRRLAFGTTALTVVWGGLELQGMLPAAIWASLYGLAVLAAGLRLGWVELRGLALVILALAALAGPVVADTEGLARSVLLFATTAGAIYLAAWRVRQSGGRTRPEERQAVEWMALGMGVLTLYWIRQEVMELPALTGTTRDFLLSAALGVYGFLVLTAGFLLRHRQTRLLAIGVVGLTLSKIVAADMWSLDLVWRVWIGAGVGTMLVVASLAYQRFVRMIVGDPPPDEPPSDRS